MVHHLVKMGQIVKWLYGWHWLLIMLTWSLTDLLIESGADYNINISWTRSLASWRLAFSGWFLNFDEAGSGFSLVEHFQLRYQYCYNVVEKSSRWVRTGFLREHMYIVRSFSCTQYNKDAQFLNMAYVSSVNYCSINEKDNNVKFCTLFYLALEYCIFNWLTNRCIINYHVILQFFGLNTCH